MIHKNTFIIASALSVALTTSAFAVQSDTAQVPHRAAHKHHVATNKSTNTASDADRDAGMYIVKPQTEPEYFGHGTGADGAMPQD